MTTNRRIPVTSIGRAALGVVFGRSLDGIVGSNPAGGMNICLLSIVCCQTYLRWLIIRPEESYRT
jgi:hypothetical protein